MNLRSTERLVLLAISLVAMGFSQTPLIIALNNGVSLHIETSLGQPNGTMTITTSTLPASGDSFFRVFRDQNNLVVYAYELVIDRPDGGDEFHLVVRPAGNRFAEGSPQADGGKPVPTLAEKRELGVMHSGQPIQFAVFSIPGAAVDVVDSIELTLEHQDSSAGAGLRFDGLKIYRNKSLVAAAAAGSVSGRFAMFYIPGQGGYFFASEPIAGKPFVEAGWFDHTRMQFTLDNVTYDGMATTPFLSQTDRGEAWVYHDPNYKPEGNWTKPLNDPADLGQPPQFFTAAANTLGFWLP